MRGRVCLVVVGVVGLLASTGCNRSAGGGDVDLAGMGEPGADLATGGEGDLAVGHRDLGGDLGATTTDLAGEGVGDLVGAAADLPAPAPDLALPPASDFGLPPATDLIPPPTTDLSPPTTTDLAPPPTTDLSPPPADMAPSCGAGPLDVSTVTVSGTVLLNGAQPTSSCSSADRATVKLDDDARNYHFSFAVPCNGATTPFTWSGVIFPGTYRITVTGGYSSLPPQPFLVDAARTITASTSGMTLDVRASSVSGTVLRNGAQPTSSCSSADRAIVKFDDDARDYHFSFAVPCNGATTPFTWSGTVFPGTYRITITGGYSNLPPQPFLAESARVISADTSFTHDVPTLAVNGTVLRNGVQPTSPCSSADRATVKFDDAARNYHFSFAVPCNGATTPFDWTGVIFPGTYTITISGGYSNLPPQPFIAESARTITADTSFTHDVTALAVSGSILRNGVQPTSPCSSADRATVKFDDGGRNYHFSFAVPCNGATTAFNWTGVVFPGTYRITITGGYSNLPGQPFLAESARTITADTTFAHDVIVYDVHGTVLRNGIQPTSPCSSADRATVKFDDAARDYHFSFPVPCNGATTPFAWTGVVFPGTYRITVTGGYSNLPPQPFVAEAARTVSGPSSFTFDVATRDLCGTVTMNGAQPTSSCSSADRATVKLDDAARDYHFSFPVPCNGATTPFSWTGVVFPGTYRVTVTGGYSTLPPQPYLIAPARPVN